MKFSSLPVFRLAATVTASLLGLVVARGQPVEWTGATTNPPTLVGWSLATPGNWSSNAIPTTADGVRFATASVNSVWSTGVNETMWLGGNRSFGNMIFDNAAGQFPTTPDGLAIVVQNSTTGSNTRFLNLTNPGSGTIITLLNNAVVTLSGYGSTAGYNVNSVLNVNLSYSGTAALNIEGGSTLTLTRSGRFTGTGGIVKTGTGTFITNPAGANFTGGFELQQGTVQIGNGAFQNATTGAVTSGVLGTGTITLSGGRLMSTGIAGRTLQNNMVLGGDVTLGDSVNNGLITISTSGDQGIFNTTTLASATTLTTDSAVVWSQAITGSHGLTKAGTANLTLSGANSYTGITNVTAGQLTVSNSSALGSTAAGTVVSSGAEVLINTSNLSIAEAFTIAGTGITGALHVGGNATGVVLSGAVSLSDDAKLQFDGGTDTKITGGISLGANDLNINGGGNLTVETNGISGTGSVSKTGNGLVVFDANNTYSGGTSIEAGTLRGSVGTGALSVAADATYELNGADRTLGTLSGAGNVVLGGNNLTTGDSTNSTFSGVISGTGGLTKAGTGTLELTGPNTYSGPTAVTGGVLSGVISAAELAISGGATYALGGSDRTITTLSGAGSVDLGANTLTTDTATDSTFSGSLTGTGGLNKAGSSTLTLSGNNTASGPTQVTAGGLRVNGTMAGTVTLATGTTLSGTGTFLNDVSLAGIHNPGNSAGLQTFANLTYQSGALVNWQLMANTASGAGANFDQIVVNGVLDFAGPITLDLSFAGLGSSVNWTDTFWNQSHSWTIFDTTTTPLNLSNLALNGTTWLDSQGNDFATTLAGATLALELDGTDITLRYTAVPEPSTYALIALGLGFVAYTLHRRRRAAA